MGAIGDRRPRTVCTIGIGRIVPIIALARGDGCLHGHRIIVGAHPVGIATVRERIGRAPIGQRHVIVDADRIDFGHRPERIEMVEDVAGTVGGMIAEIFRPVGAIAQLAAGSENGADIACQ